MNEVKATLPQDHIILLYGCLTHALHEEQVHDICKEVEFFNDFESLEETYRHDRTLDEKIKKKAQATLLILKALREGTKAHIETLCSLNESRQKMLGTGVKKDSKEVTYFDTFYKISPGFKKEELPSLLKMADEHLAMCQMKSSQKSQNPKEILELPKSIVKKIFAYIDPADIPNAARTCRKFSTILKDSLLTHTILSHNTKVFPLMQDAPCILAQLRFCKMIKNSLYFEEKVHSYRNNDFYHLFASKDNVICYDGHVISRISFIGEPVLTQTKRRLENSFGKTIFNDAFISFDLTEEAIIKRDVCSGEISKSSQCKTTGSHFFDPYLPLIAIRDGSGTKIFDYSDEEVLLVDDAVGILDHLLLQNGSLIIRSSSENIMQVLPRISILENTKGFTPIHVTNNHLLFCVNRKNTIKAFDLKSELLICEFNILDYTKEPISSCHFTQGILFTSHNNILCAWNMMKMELIKSFPFSDRILDTALLDAGIFVMLPNKGYFAKFDDIQKGA